MAGGLEACQQSLGGAAGQIQVPSRTEIRRKEISKQESLFVKNQNLTAEFFSSTENFLDSFTNDWFHNETILLKGARSFAFERIGKRVN